MSVIIPNIHSIKGVVGYRFWCPGCQCTHQFDTVNTRGEGQHLWKFNGNFERPTFTPSLRYLNTDEKGNIIPGSRCHLILTDGIIGFKDDCLHSLREQKVPLIHCNYLV